MMNREIKFRVWYGDEMVPLGLAIKDEIVSYDFQDYYIQSEYDDMPLMQYTGLKDKNGKEIYELMELDNEYRVIWDRCSFVLQDISSGDIVGLLDNSLRRANETEITREYSPLEKDQERFDY
jgi:hypothetical protein